MSNVSLKKPFKHFATNALFYAAKVSVNAENTKYIQNGEVHDGTPDILWEHTVFIHDIAQIWNRGRYYNSQKYLGKLAAISKNSFQMYSGMTIVTLIDKNPESMDATNYANYPGILPSIVVTPGTIQDIDIILSLADKGCDILSTAFNGISVYDATETDANNYDNILEDMIVVEQWFADHGLLTNCYKYPDASKAQGESEFIQRYEEYGLIEAATATNGVYQDNMLLNGKVINDSNVGEAISEIGNGNGNWLIYILNGLSSSNIALLNEAIQSGIDNDTCIYMQMHEGLQMRGSEFNVGRSENELPFRVYKNGKVDADLTASALEVITETVIGQVGPGIAKEIPGAYMSYNETTGKLDWDDSVLENYVEKEEGKGLSTNDFTTAYMSKLEGIAAGAEVNVQSDWNVSDNTSDAYIANKPEIPSIDGLATIAYVNSEDAKKVDKTIKVNGHALDADVTVTKSDVGLSNVTNDAQVKRSEMGANSGVATLDENGKVPSAQLPSYVDDVIEGYLYNNKFWKESTHETEIPAESGKIYIDLVSNKEYRWGGTQYVVVSETLALGETSSTAFPGDRGKALETGKVDKEEGKGLSTNDFTTAYMSKLEGIAAGAEVNVQSDWNVSDNTSDAYIANKPEIPSIDGLATIAYVNSEDAKKVDKEEGKGLSTNDFTTAYMSKLEGIAAGAEVNVQSDWNATEGDALILNKPTLGTASAKDFTTSITGSTYLPTDAAVKSYLGSYVATTYTTLYNYIDEVEEFVSETLSEFKTTYIDTMLSDANMWKITYFMAEHFFSYINSKGENFLRVD